MSDLGALGPAELIVQTLLKFDQHLIHNRPGIVTSSTGDFKFKWAPVYSRKEGDQTHVFAAGSSVPLGQLVNGDVVSGTRRVGRYQPPGVFVEAVLWIYSGIAEIWKLDNEFVAKWASWAFTQDHRDLKTVLAAFMLVQNRIGSPEKEGGKVLFYDADYRDVGEAMLLHTKKTAASDLSPKQLLQIYDILRLPGIADINRGLGFGVSLRKPFFGRYPLAITKWLRYREDNPALLNGLVRAGYRSTVRELARRVGYKPQTKQFFQTLRWKQSQSKGGHRTLGIGDALVQADNWDNLSEAEVCQKILLERPSFKAISGRVSLSRAIVAAAIGAGVVTQKEFVILTPTLEELGLLSIPDIKSAWEKALSLSSDQRARNVAKRVSSKDVADKLQESADGAMTRAVSEAVRGLRIYFFVDVSGSMRDALSTAERYITGLLGGFPLDKLHVAVFNTVGREVRIQHSSVLGVQQAFRGISPSGGTNYGAGPLCLKQYRPGPDEDALFIFVGDDDGDTFAKAVRDSCLNPVAFGMIRVGDLTHRHAVAHTARELLIPYFPIDTAIFEDVYAIPRVLRTLIASAPVGEVSGRKSLISVIQETPLLAKPLWA